MYHVMTLLWLVSCDHSEYALILIDLIIVSLYVITCLRGIINHTMDGVAFNLHVCLAFQIPCETVAHMV